MVAETAGLLIDHNMKRRLGETARTCILEQFNWRIAVATLDQFYFKQVK
jgi:hypothetical protein